jgi:hypothetical protein
LPEIKFALETMMVCETEQGILDEALANYDEVISREETHNLEGEYIQMMKLSAMGQVTMAYWIVQNCLANSGNGLMAVSPDQGESSLLTVPSASELLEFQKNVLPGLLKSRK